MQGGLSFIATTASNSEVKNGESLESYRCNNSQNYYRVNGDFVAPKQIWRLVSAASNTSNGELKKDELLESSSSNSLQSSCSANGDFKSLKQKWRPVSGGTFPIKDTACASCEANQNVDVAGEILLKMQGDPSFIATGTSNGEAKNGETMESSLAINSQNYHIVNGDIVAPKKIWRQVSAASNTSNVKLKKDEPFESSSSNSLQNSCPANGDLGNLKQKWRPVSGGIVSLKDIACASCEAKQNVDVAGEIMFKMQGDPSFIATSASNGKVKNGETLESSVANNSQNYYRVNGDFVAPKQIRRQVSAVSSTTNCELKKNEPLESSSSNSSQNCCPANGDLRTIKQKWRPVSGGTVSLKDIASSYSEANQNVDVAGEIQFNMQGDPSFISTSASNGEAKNGETYKSSPSNDSQNYYRVNGDFVAPKQIWRQVSDASNTSNGELKKDEPLESSSSNSSQNSCPSNGDLGTIKQKWRPVSRGTVTLKDITSYCEANPNVDVAGKIQFNMQGDPSFIATSASNGKFLRETSESSRSNDSQNYYRVNGDFVAPKQILRQVSAASNTSNGELKKDEPLESSSSYSLHDSCPTNGGLRTIKQKWRPVSTGTVSVNDIASSYCEANRNADVAGEIQFKMQGEPSFIATDASNGEAKYGETLQLSRTNNSQNYYRVNGDFVAPKQIWRQVSAPSNTSNDELKKDEPLDSSSSNSSQNSCPSNGDLRTIKQKWRPVSGGTVSLNDIASSYCEANPNVDVGEIQFKMQGDPSFIATNASNGEAKYGEALESSCANNSQNCYRVNGDFVAPKKIWRQVSAVSNTSNGELKKDESFESSNTNSLQNSCPENGDLRTIKQKWRPVSGGTVSLKDIASEYCEANQNVDVAGEILFKQGDPSFIATSASNGEAKNGKTLESSCANNSQAYYRVNGDFVAPKQMWRQVSTASNTSNGELKKDEPLESSSSNSSQNSCPENGDLRTLKQKWRQVSGGTVSSLRVKVYMQSAPSTNGSNPRTKPLKVESKEWPVSVLWGEHKSSSLKEDRLHKDMEDFLFKMLGVGFQLGRNVINEVLDNCGYDMQKSMEKLLDLSAAGLDERSKLLGESNKKTNDRHSRAKEPSCEKNKVFECQWRSKLIKGQKQDPKGELVEGPLVDSVVMAKVDTVSSQEDKKDDEDEEDSFQYLRRAVEEYRGMMKEYYKAAFEAFTKGDQDLANRLVEQGQFYREKARQADEESNQKIFDTWNMDTEYEMLLDLHDHGAKEAVRLLKCHLSSLAGIPSFKYLKVIVDKNEEEASKGTRRRSVMRLLEKESITWNEGETLGIIRIQMDNINPKNLSFAKKNPSL